MKKAYKGTAGIEIHHILEKRLKNILKKTTPNDMLSIPLTKEVHREITNRWRKAIPYGTDYKELKKVELIDAVKAVYYDLPELKQKALKCVEDYYGKH